MKKKGRSNREQVKYKKKMITKNNPERKKCGCACVCNIINWIQKFRICDRVNEIKNEDKLMLKTQFRLLFVSDNHKKDDDLNL